MQTEGKTRKIKRIPMSEKIAANEETKTKTRKIRKKRRTQKTKRIKRLQVFLLFIFPDSSLKSSSINTLFKAWIQMDPAEGDLLAVMAVVVATILVAIQVTMGGTPGTPDLLIQVTSVAAGPGDPIRLRRLAHHQALHLQVPPLRVRVDRGGGPPSRGRRRTAVKSHCFLFPQLLVFVTGK